VELYYQPNQQFSCFLALCQFTDRLRTFSRQSRLPYTREAAFEQLDIIIASSRTDCGHSWDGRPRGTRKRQLRDSFRTFRSFPSALGQSTDIGGTVDRAVHLNDSFGTVSGHFVAFRQLSDRVRTFVGLSTARYTYTTASGQFSDISYLFVSSRIEYGHLWNGRQRGTRKRQIWDGSRTRSGQGHFSDILWTKCGHPKRCKTGHIRNLS